MSDEIPAFNGLVEQVTLDGDKVSLNDILNKEIIVTGEHTSTSKFKDKGSGFCVKIQFYYADDVTKTKRVFFSGSTVIKDQIDEVKEALEKQGLPLLFKTTVKKVGNYYSFV